jgi:thiol:disulfide interchange protein DsbD
MHTIRPGRPAFSFLLRLAALLALPLAALGARAQDDESSLLPIDQAYQLSADTATPGVLKLHWAIAPDYYLYRGRIRIKSEDGTTLAEPSLPDGKKYHDQYLGDVETYHGQVDASVPYALAAGASSLKVSVQYQGCHEVDPKICYPPRTQHLDLPLGRAMTATIAPAANADASAPAQPGAQEATPPAAPQSLGGALPGAAGHPFGQPAGAAPGMDGPALPAEQAFRFEALARSPHELLLRWTMPKGYYLYRDQTTLSLQDAGGLALGKPAWPDGMAHHDQYYGDTVVFYDQVELPVPVTGDAAGHAQLKLHARFQGCQEGGLCYPPMERTVTVDLGGGSVAATPAGDAAAAQPAPEMPPPAVLAKTQQGPLDTGLLAALLLALGGGLVLNLMPCVLPVLSIKAVSLLESGESPAHARRHALFYTAGVLCSFAAVGLAIVGLRSAGHALGWGAQLQQPLLVGVLACVMVAVGLSMSGVVQFGASLGGAGQSLASRGGPAGDFFTGVLAVLVASPCTAPFMGSALAYAFAAPMLSALLVFLALGLGLALPFLAIGFVPALARLLPRPGAWMETLKQVLAFPMYLTAVWLVWVLAHQRGADAVGLVLVAAVLLAMTLWWFERSRYRGAPSRVLVAVLAVLTLVPLYYLGHLTPPVAAAAAADDGTVAFSPGKLAELRRQGTPVFVDMTADWCVTCKANEHAVLDTAAFRDLLKRTGTVYMKGDWTDVNPTISAFLQQYQSPGVPLYVAFPAGGGDGRKLPTVLTQSLLEQALDPKAG